MLTNVLGSDLVEEELIQLALGMVRAVIDTKHVAHFSDGILQENGPFRIRECDLR